MTQAFAAPLPGFREPAKSSRTVFRFVLEAMSRPGMRVGLPDLGLRPPADAPISAAAVLLTLLDHETPFWASADFDGPELRAWVAFHTGAPFAREAGAARFALTRANRSATPLSVFNPGEDRYPDRSATLVIACESLDGGARVALSGPGIESRQIIAPRGPRPIFWDEARANHARFPLGVDLILCAGAELLALPRSTRISALGEVG